LLVELLLKLKKLLLADLLLVELLLERSGWRTCY
jgi:hypothetical protein